MRARRVGRAGGVPACVLVCVPVCVHVRVFGVGEGTGARVHTHALLPPESVNCCPISAVATQPGELRVWIPADLQAGSLLHRLSHSPVWVSVSFWVKRRLC